MNDNLIANSKVENLLDTNQNTWLENQVLHPAYNAGVVTPYNAVANAANGALRAVNADVALPKLDLAEQKPAAALSADWAVQNLASGAAAILPFVIAGKVAGVGMRASGNILGLEGTAAKLAASGTTAQIAGVAALEGFRDLHPGETHFGNAAAAASAFAIFAGANPYSRDLAAMVSGASRTTVRGASLVAIGAFGSASSVVVADAISQGKLPDADRMLAAAMSGGFMNAFLPMAQSKVGSMFDRAGASITGSMPLESYIRENKLANTSHGEVRSTSLQVFNEMMPLARVSTRGGTGSRNTLAMDDHLIKDLKTGNGTAQEAARTQTALYLGEQLAARYRSAHGIPEGILSNNGIELAMRQGRLAVYEKGPGGVDSKVIRRENIGNNTLDVHLDDTFVRIPRTQATIDLGKTPPKEVIKGWQSSQHPEGITIQPGELLLAFTSERISIPSGPKLEWKGHPALIGDINSPSSIGRMGLEVHQTAPVLNNGTNNRITLEIVNNNPNPIHLVPGMKIASIVFRTLTGHPEGSAQQSHFHGQESPTGLSALAKAASDRQK